MAVVGSAEVIVRAITSSIQKDIQKAFADVRPEIKKEGEKAGKAYSDGFNTGIGDDIANNLRASMSSATADVSRNIQSTIPDAARRAGAQAGAQLEAGIGGAGSRAGRAAGGGFFRTFSNDVRGAINRLANLSSAFDLLGPSIANVVGALSSVVSGLFAVISVAGQAAGALAVLPGLLGVLFQSLGAAQFAFSGVGEAVKAGTAAQEAAAAPIAATTKASQAATKAAAAQKKATDEVAKANERLKDSQDEVTNAEKLYEMTQRDLVRAQDQKNEGLKSEAAAEYFLADAKKRRDAVVADPNASSGQGAAAQKEYDDARYAMKQNEKERAASATRVQKAEERNNAARERLSKALRARQAAQDKADKAKNKQAKARIEPVPIVTPAQKAADAYAAAMAKLTPEARDFVKEILSIKERFSEVSDVIAKNMLPPLTESLQLLQSDDVKFFDILKSELGETGKLLGGIALEATKAFTTDRNMSLFQKYLDGNNKILETLSTNTDGAKSPIEALVSIFLKLGNAIQPVTQRFAEFIGQTLIKFDQNNSLNSLTDFFNRAGDEAARLGRIAGNIIGILGGLGGAAEGSGKSLINSFEKATAKLEKFIKTPENQKKLKAFFKGVEKNFRAIAGFITRITYGFLKLGDNKGIAAMIEGFEDGEKAIGELAEKLTSEELGRDIGEFGSSIAELINSFAQSGQMEVFIDTLTGFVDSLVWVIDKVGKANKAVTDFTGINFGAFILGAFAIYRAFKLAFSFAGFGKSFDKLMGKIGNGLKSIGKKAKNAIRPGSATPATPATTTTPGGADDVTRANADGENVGRAYNAGMAEGIRLSTSIVETAIDTMLIKLHSDSLVSSKALGREIGDSIVEGVALGIRTNTSKAIAAIRALGNEVIVALKARLGIASPSKVMANIGEDTGQGFVVGMTTRTDDAFRAGQRLGASAAAGARSASAGVATAGAAAAAPVGAVAAGPAKGAVGPSPKAVSKLGTGASKAMKPIKGLKVALAGLSMALIGLSWPVVAVVAAIGAIVFMFVKLYKHSPAFKKFIDSLVGKLKEFGKWIGDLFIKQVFPALDKFFGWVNEKLPAIGAFFADVFGKIKLIIMEVFVPLWKNTLLPAIKQLGKMFAIVFPAAVIIFKAFFNVVKFYITKIFIPAWKIIFSAIKDLIPTVRNAFTVVKSYWDNTLKPVFSNMKTIATNVFQDLKDRFESIKSAFRKVGDVFSTVGEAIGTAFSGIKSAASVPIKFIVDTLWNKGLVKMADWIPGVDVGGWTVDTSGWAKGGYTGPGGKYDVAGLVHRDEFVIQKSSRRILEQMYPGLLDFINKTGKLPNGHSSGGAVRGAYSGAVPPSMRGLRGYDAGSIVSGIGGAVAGGFKWAGDKVIDGVKWTAEKAKAMMDAIDKVLDFIAEFPEKIAAGMSESEWGRQLTGIPKAAIGRLLTYINDFIPNSLPGISDNPFSSPFGNIDFRASGGRVQAGMPYIVGELRPELFVPDRNGTIIPDISKMSSRTGGQTAAGGPALQVNIDKVEAHDYQDFMAQMQRRSRAQSLGGFTLPSRSSR